MTDLSTDYRSIVPVCIYFGTKLQKTYKMCCMTETKLM